MSLKPEIWGRDGWKFMHYVSLGYPENPSPSQKEEYKNFYYSIRHVLPCKKCAKHYAENLQKFPLTNEILSNKEKLINWVIDIHNEVNKSKNKPVLDYDQARKEMGKHSDCNHKTKEYNLLFILIGILFVLLTVGIIYKKKNKYN